MKQFNVSPIPASKKLSSSFLSLNDTGHLLTLPSSDPQWFSLLPLARAPANI